MSAPLRTRLRISNWRRNRYASDPDFRLRLVNSARARRGLPLLASAAEIKSKSQAARETAMRRRRGEGGRFA